MIGLGVGLCLLGVVGFIYSIKIKPLMKQKQALDALSVAEIEKQTRDIIKQTEKIDNE